MSANMNDLAVIKAGGNVFAYDGSLTTPPCAETVSWRVMQAFEPVCAAQLATLKQLFKPDGNFRAIQPLFSRKVSLCKATPVDSISLSLQREQSVSLPPKKTAKAVAAQHSSSSPSSSSGAKKPKSPHRKRKEGNLIIANRNHVVVNCGGKCT